MSKFRFVMAAIAAAVAVAGCATTVIGPGARQGDVPPSLVLRDNVIAWDNPAAFGPVPAELAANAAKVCSSLDTGGVRYKATGYHAMAVGLGGDPFPGGGYYCVPK